MPSELEDSTERQGALLRTAVGVVRVLVLSTEAPSSASRGPGRVEEGVAGNGEER
jgi:hypothetical protein